MAYIILLGMVGILRLFFIGHNKYNKLLYVMLTYLMLAVFIVLQKSIGPDHDSYITIFDTIANTPWSDLSSVNLSVEFGFLYLNKFLSVFISKGEIFIRVYMLFIVGLYGIVCYKRSVNPFYFTLIFIFLMFAWLPIIRQATAVAIIALGLGFIKKRKIIQYILVVLLACLFHISALVALAIYPVCNTIKYSRLYWLLAFVMIFFIILLDTQLVQIFRYIVGQIDTRYERYFYAGSFAINMTLLLSGLFLILCFFLDTSKKENIVAINIMVFAILLQSFSAFTPMAGRIMLYVYPLLCLSLERILIQDEYDLTCMCLIRTSKSIKNTIGIGIIGVMLVYWWITYISSNAYILL